MYSSLAFLFLLCLTIPTKAQQLVSTAGDLQAGASVQATFSVGEFAVQTLTGTTMLTQGFQQPYTSVTDLSAPFIEGFFAYPNPVHAHLMLAVSAPGWYQWQVFDLHGRQVLSGNTLLAEEIALSMERLEPGHYVLQVSHSETGAAARHRFLKANP